MTTLESSKMEDTVVIYNESESKKSAEKVSLRNNIFSPTSHRENEHFFFMCNHLWHNLPKVS